MIQEVDLGVGEMVFMLLHFLDPKQFQLLKFDCIGQDSAFAELALRGGRTYPMAGGGGGGGG